MSPTARSRKTARPNAQDGATAGPESAATPLARPARPARRTRPSGEAQAAPPPEPAVGKASGGASGKAAAKGPRTPAVESSPPLAGVAVRESAIHGLGLFATRAVEEGELIGVYAGPRSRKVDTYVLWVEDEQGRAYGIDGRNEMRYVNHSPDPNASFEGEELWALRRIEPGEEITHHYGEDWEDL